MRRIVLTFIAILMAHTASASWYIFKNDTYECVGKTSYEPDINDLNSRNEFAFFSKKDMTIDRLEFFNNDIRKRAETSDEKEQRKAEAAAAEEQKIINKRIMYLATKSLEDEGVKLKKSKSSDFK
jgi:hypothetical protein